MSRRSYKGLLQLPAWGLKDGEQLVATVRAATAEDARAIFKLHNQRHPEMPLIGDRITRLDRK